VQGLRTEKERSETIGESGHHSPQHTPENGKNAGKATNRGEKEETEQPKTLTTPGVLA